ncbi:hypothetical protein [Streptomyces sp. NPDC101166]|uniref:hypothetical protein n=1 Tax=Streptomyces sp. NPDC101166 TaxID=3366120 RepID=UPI0038170756
MSEYFWPEDYALGSRARRAWSNTVDSLPVASLVTGTVIGRQPFGVFIDIDQVSDAVGLLRVTALPRDAELPAKGEFVEGQVLWHDPSHFQVIVVPVGGAAESDSSAARLDALRKRLSGE